MHLILQAPQIRRQLVPPKQLAWVVAEIVYLVVGKIVIHFLLVPLWIRSTPPTLIPRDGKEIVVLVLFGCTLSAALLVL
jgi:hypothetical protein